MAYEKQNWNNGEVITANKLNHMEDGIATGVLVVGLQEDGSTLDKTWQEIYDAMLTNGAVIITEDGGTRVATITQCRSANSKYVVLTGSDAYIVNTTDGYPVYEGIN